MALLAFSTMPAAAGVKLGAQITTGTASLVGDLPEDGSWEGQVVPGAGIVAEYYFNPAVALSLQPAYAQRDTRQVFRTDGVVVSSTDYDINYLSIPLILRVTTDPGGVRGFVTAGFDVSVLLDAAADDGTGPVDIADTFHSTTFGALLGAGAIFPVKKHQFTVEVRYVQGLDDIVDRSVEDSDSGLSSPSVKYRGLNLQVGFLFSLGGE